MQPLFLPQYTNANFLHAEPIRNAQADNLKNRVSSLESQLQQVTARAEALQQSLDREAVRCDVESLC